MAQKDVSNPVRLVTFPAHTNAHIEVESSQRVRDLAADFAESQTSVMAPLGGIPSEEISARNCQQNGIPNGIRTRILALKGPLKRRTQSD
jgi:hypothetical protein